jgi:hypothetical protein
MSDAGLLPPSDAAAPVQPFPNGADEPVELDLRALVAHFQGYEIVDPVTVALRPVTIATPSAATTMGRR